jgi:hypothetical protein
MLNTLYRVWIGQGTIRYEQEIQWIEVKVTIIVWDIVFDKWRATEKQ